MAFSIDSLVLDGVPLTSGAFTLMEITADPPKSRADWITAADSESAALSRQPLYENRTITMKLRVTPQASMNVALDQVGSLVDKIRRASSTGAGVALVWTPAGSTRTATFDVLSGEMTGLPIALSGDGFSWLLQRPIVTIELTAKPYIRLAELTTVTDAFASDTIANYTFDAGAAGNVSITGGVMDAAANLTTENRLLHTASPYSVTNAMVTAKHTLGTTLTSYKAGVILKRLDASNYLEVYVDDTGAASRLRIDRVIAGSRTNLQSTNLAARLIVSTAYWVRARLEGNVVYAEHWLTAPTVTGAATLSTTVTLAGGDATTLGTGVQGRTGLVWLPQQTAATLDDFEMAPNVARSSTPFVTLELPNVPGDVPALVSATVTDAASQSRRHAEWGLEGPLTYNSATSPLIDSDDMVTSGFAGAQSTLAGAYDPNASGNSVISATLYTTAQPVAVCGTGNLSHVGSFRVKGRVHGGNPGDLVRLSWKALDGPTSANTWATLQRNGEWEEVDLGTIIIPVATVGTQRWTGQVEAQGSVAGTSITVDYLTLVPASDGYGKARASYSYQPGVLVGFDAFVGTVSGNALSTRTASLGGNWATSGDTTDFKFDDSFTTSDSVESLMRDTNAVETTGRFAILGSAAYTDMQVDVRSRIGTSGTAKNGLIARWVDSSNYVRLVVPSFAAGGTATTKLEQVLAGVVTVLAESPWQRAQQTPYRFRLTVFATGRAIAQVLSDAGSLLAELQGSSSALTTGGALDDGKPGLYDISLAADGEVRRFTEFAVSTPPAEPIVVFSGRNIQIRHDDTLRQDSTGTYTGRPPSYRGSRFLAPVGTSRALFKVRRNDIENAADDQVTDATQVQINWTPRCLAVPRS